MKNLGDESVIKGSMELTWIMELLVIKHLYEFIPNCPFVCLDYG